MRLTAGKVLLDQSMLASESGSRSKWGERGRIKSAISVLAAQGLVHVEHTKSFRSEFGIANAYRLAFIQPRVHMGTFGRGMDEAGL